MAIVDRSGIPISLRVESASPHESQLVEGALRERHIKDLPCRLWVTKLTTVIPWRCSFKRDIELNLLLLASQIERKRLKMEDLLEDTNAAGESSDFFHGYNHFVE